MAGALDGGGEGEGWWAVRAVRAGRAARFGHACKTLLFMTGALDGRRGGRGRWAVRAVRAGGGW